MTHINSTSEHVQFLLRQLSKMHAIHWQAVTSGYHAPRQTAHRKGLFSCWAKEEKRQHQPIRMATVSVSQVENPDWAQCFIVTSMSLFTDVTDDSRHHLNIWLSVQLQTQLSYTWRAMSQDIRTLIMNANRTLFRDNSQVFCTWNSCLDSKEVVFEPTSILGVS